jgi:hypothetical protein
MSEPRLITDQSSDGSSSDEPNVTERFVPVWLLAVIAIVALIIAVGIGLLVAHIAHGGL